MLRREDSVTSSFDKLRTRDPASQRLWRKVRLPNPPCGARLDDTSSPPRGFAPRRANPPAGEAGRQEFSTTFWVQSKSLASAKRSNEKSPSPKRRARELGVGGQMLLTHRPRCILDRAITTVTNPKMMLVESASPPRSIKPVMMGPPTRQRLKAVRYLFMCCLLSGLDILARHKLKVKLKAIIFNCPKAIVQ